MIFVEEAYGHSSLWVINKSAYQIALFFKLTSISLSITQLSAQSILCAGATWTKRYQFTVFLPFERTVVNTTAICTKNIPVINNYKCKTIHIIYIRVYNGSSKHFKMWCCFWHVDSLTVLLTGASTNKEQAAWKPSTQTRCRRRVASHDRDR